MSGPPGSRTAAEPRLFGDRLGIGAMNAVLGAVFLLLLAAATVWAPPISGAVHGLRVRTIDYLREHYGATIQPADVARMPSRPGTASTRMHVTMNGGRYLCSVVIVDDQPIEVALTCARHPARQPA